MWKLNKILSRRCRFAAHLKTMKNEVIEMIKMPLSAFLRVVAFCLPLALVASCGGAGSSGSEAVQSTITTINPVSVGVTSPTTSALVPLYVVQQYQITLRSPTGDTQIGTKVTIISSGLLYAGFVVVDDAAVTCTAPTTGPATCTNTALTPLSSVYETITDSNGTVRVTLLFPFYSGSKGTATVLESFSGTSYGKTDIVFTCVGSTTLPCPT